MRAVLGLAAVAALAVLPGCDPARSTVDRPEDPVVLTGSALPRLRGRAPQRIVAFRYASGAWAQVPVQVDERAVVDFGVPPSSTPGPGTVGTVYGTSASGVTALQYTDAGTFTGADRDASFDSDDELVFMSSDLGGLAPDGEPAGVQPGSGVEVTVTDPLVKDSAGWLYLFESTGALVPSAGRSYVSYDFRLLSGDYRTTYRRGDGPNPENSAVSTSRYSHHFSDRWLDDQLVVRAGSSSAVDVLDRHKNLFAPDQCGRSEDTFNDAEGAFVVNKAGPVRAIRSYVGANSGPRTQRTHFFYAGRHDIATDLRVHAIPSVMDFFDYSPAASGMRYANDRNRNGVVVDGQPDSVAAGRLSWELLTGAQGSVIHTQRLQTNVAALQEPEAVSSYYLDDATPSVVQCTGDATAYGSSGPWVVRGIPDTDPASGTTNVVRALRSTTYRPPGVTNGDADLAWQRIAFGLAATTRDR
ncbi:MAG: hypothetical protein H0U89_08235 [Acidimicrobiia bacterium]|nr:hypothetical protein [Acidimicrobiia bacterium]